MDAQNLHSEVGPSVHPRIVICAASVKASRPFPNESTFAAETGTRRHKLVELCLATGRYPTDFPTGGEWAEYTADDREAAGQVVDFWRDAMLEFPGEVFSEYRVDLSFLWPGMFGSLDFAIVSGRTLYVSDAKFGRVHVPATTVQNKSYALGLLKEFGDLYDFDRVVCSIAQPEGNNFDRVEYTPAELYAWAADVLVPKLTEAFGPNPTYTPDEVACKYCRARGSCRARIDAHYTATSKLLDAVDMPDLLTPAEIADLIARSEKFEAVLNDVKAHAMRTLITGGQIPGLKLVEGVARRKYANPDSAVHDLADALREKRPELSLRNALSEVSEVSPVGLTKAEKLIGKTNPVFQRIVVKPQGKPNLVPESDPRPAFTPTDVVSDLLDSIEI